MSFSHLQLTAVLLSRLCFPACTHAHYTGFFVAEKNAFKLILTSVKKNLKKKQQMFFLQLSTKTKCCGNELLKDLHVVAER